MRCYQGRRACVFRAAGRETELSFERSPELAGLRLRARDLIQRELAPIVEECDANERFPRELVPVFGEAGLLRVGHSRAYGGTEGGVTAQTVVIEEVARVSAGVASAIQTAFFVPRMISDLGTADQIEEYAKPLIEGAKIAALAISEADAGSDVRHIRTRADVDGDHYVMSGDKMFITNAIFADFLIVVAVTDDSQGIDGMTLFLLDANTPGYRHVRKLKKEALRTCETSAIAFEGCRIPLGNRVGPEGAGFKGTMAALNADRILNCARSIGIAQASFDASVDYAQRRKQFGNPIGSYQAIAFKIADMAVKLEAARLLTERAAWLFDSGQDYVYAVSVAKLFASEACVEIARDAVQVHGGYGVITDYPVGRYMRDSLVSTIGAGTSEIQRRVVARKLGLPVQ